MDLSPTAMRVLEARYLLKDKTTGNIVETPWDMFHRVAKAVAEAELAFVHKVGQERAAENQTRYAAEFQGAMAHLDFLPNSPTLMNAGTANSQLSACFLLPVEDDIESIFETVKHMAMIFKSGGGVGLPMSRLRQKGARVKSTGGVSSGPVSFMRVYNTTAEVVAQGGKRRGALMGVLRVDHPDILEFINVKQDLTQLTSFNLSVAVTDQFMYAVEAGENYDLYDPRGCASVGRLSAREVWGQIVACAHRTGEPGIVFIDAVNHAHASETGLPGFIEGTNPCVTGDTWVVVADGMIEKVGNLVGCPCNVFVHGQMYATKGFFFSGRKEVFEVVLNHGALSVKATADHTFFRYDGDILRKVKLSELLVGDLLPLEHPTIEQTTGMITSIDPCGVEDVYDIQVPGVNAFVANGIVVGNCGELPLLPYESCNLASINLSNFVKNEYRTGAAFIDHDRLEFVASLVTRFLDDVIEVNRLPLPQIEEATRRTRKIGLGVMGFAEMLIKLGVRYGTDASVSVLRDVLKTVHAGALKTSVALGDERGHYDMHGEGDGPRRNATLLAIAPTGSISMIADVTGGIEPMFAVTVKRESVLDGVPFIQTNSVVAELMEKNGWSKDEISMAMEGVIAGKPFSQAAKDACVHKNADDFSCVVCAHEVWPDRHVAMQAAAQTYVDSAVSKSVNLPHEATQDDVAAVFKQAYTMGCKGITVYRDGCREHQPMSVAAEPDVSKEKGKLLTPSPVDGDKVGEGHTEMLNKTMNWQDALVRLKRLGIEPPQPLAEEKPHGDVPKLRPKERPDVLPGSTVKLQTGCGTLFVTISTDEHGQPVELFAHHGKAGVCSQAQCEAIGRLCSMSLRSGIDPDAVVNQLRGITCHETAGMGPKKVLSCADGIAQAIGQVLAALQKKAPQAPPKDDPEATRKTSLSFSGSCPQCGSGTIREAGCVVCKVCGWERCS